MWECRINSFKKIMEFNFVGLKNWNSEMCFCSNIFNVPVNIPCHGFLSLSYAYHVDCYFINFLVSLLFRHCVQSIKSFHFEKLKYVRNLNFRLLWQLSVTLQMFPTLCLISDARVDPKSFPRGFPFPAVLLVLLKTGPVPTRHRSHHFATQSSHSVDRAGWQAKMASIEF